MACILAYDIKNAIVTRLFSIAEGWPWSQGTTPTPMDIYTAIEPQLFSKLGACKGHVKEAWLGIAVGFSIGG